MGDTVSSRRLFAVLVFVLLGGCTSDPASGSTVPAEPSIVRTPGGATITLPIESPVEHQVDGLREQFRSADGAVWSVQVLDRTATGAGESIEEVAIALCHRIELGEIAGELTHRACTFAGQPAQCVDGWQAGRDGDRVTRRGAILRLGDDTVWISLAAREGTVAIDPLATSLADETRVTLQ